MENRKQPDESRTADTPQGEALTDEVDEPHTGDDALLDCLTAIRSDVEQLADANIDERYELTASILDELDTADKIRVAEWKTKERTEPSTDGEHR